MHRLLIAWLGSSLLFWAACAQAAHDFVVGVLPYQGARAIIAEHRTLAVQLQAALQRPVRIVTARNTRIFGQRMLAGEYDLAIAPAHLARLAQVERGWTPLARYTPDTQVYLLTAASRSGDPIAPGITLAVPDHAMLVTLIVQAWLAQYKNLDEGDYTLLETGSHSASIQAVLDRHADAAVGVLAAIGQVRKGSVGRMRIVHEIGSMPLLVFAARAGTPPPVLAATRRTLLAYPAPPRLRVVQVDSTALSGMDRFLPRTRLLLARSETPHAE